MLSHAGVHLLSGSTTHTCIVDECNKTVDIDIHVKYTQQKLMRSITQIA